MWLKIIAEIQKSVYEESKMIENRIDEIENWLFEYPLIGEKM